MAYYPERGVAVAMQINADRTRLAEHLDQLARVVFDSLSDSSQP